MKKILRLYRRILSPLFHEFYRIFSGNAYSGCRFEPTCSCYFEESVEKHGWRIGLFKSLRRILKCHPFNRSGGYDPV